MSLVSRLCRLYKSRKISTLLGAQSVEQPHLCLLHFLSVHTDAKAPEDLSPQTDGRILHNCLLKRMSVIQARELVKEKKRQEKLRRETGERELPSSAFLSVLSDHTRPQPQQAASDPVSPEESMFPFSGVTTVEFTAEEAEEEELPGDPLPADTTIQLSVRERVRQLREQERRQQEAADSGQELDQLWVLRYGHPDPSVPASEAVCGGCGAHFHCQQPSWPGYMPSEVMRAASEAELHELLCQRCYFLRYHSAAVNVSVRPEDYRAMMARMGRLPALLVLLVDLLDFPCSIWPDIADLVGRSRPLVVVGNKVDLLPQDSEGYLQRVEQSLTAALERCGVDKLNIQHTCLISARTGYGVEELISVLQTHWAAQGDVYLLGCTNTGKSTLFNALLRSDMCKSKAHDLIQRATTSRWPGTTLSLLKFPMHRPLEFHYHKRQYRLRKERPRQKEEEELRRSRLLETGDPQYATLMGHIGRTFRGPRARDAEATVLEVEPQPPPERLGGIAANDRRFPGGRWVYDTPGFVTEHQVIGQLTQEELLLTLSARMLQPRTFALYPGQTLFVAGLGRLDYHSGPSMVRLTVFASADLPVTVVATDDADAIYEQYLHSGLFVVPCGGAARMARWCGLRPVRVTVTGGSVTESAADIVLSSAGWLAVTPCEDRSGENSGQLQFTAHTPGAAGVFVRSPAVLPLAVRLRGRRYRDSPEHRPSRLFQLLETRTASGR